MNTIHHPEWLKEGVRIVLRLRRNKDGGVGNVDRHAKKIITRNPEEWSAAIEHLCKDMAEGERIYATLDSRDLKRAAHEFKKRQLDNDLAEDPGSFYVDIYNRFVSCLQNPIARAETLFLWDCDNEPDRIALSEIFERHKDVVDVVYQYPTKSGHHIITKPFNYPSVVPVEKCKLLRLAALVLVAY